MVSSGTLMPSAPHTEPKHILAKAGRGRILRTELVIVHALCVLPNMKAGKGRNASVGECHQGAWRMRVRKVEEVVTWRIATIYYSYHLYNVVHVLFLECSFLAMYVQSLFFVSTYMIQLGTLHNVFCECW